jgi:hypothetical protein
VTLPPVSVYAVDVLSVSYLSMIASASRTSSIGLTPVYGRPAALCWRQLWLMSQYWHSSLAPKYWQTRKTVR